MAGTTKPIHWAWTAMSAAALLTVILYVANVIPLERQKALETKEELQLRLALKLASGNCLIGTTNKEQRQIELGVFDRLAGSAKGGTSVETIGNAVDASLSEDGKLTLTREIRECMAKITSYYLRFELGSDAPPASTPVNPATGRPLSGFAYYEERNGGLSPDGVFKLLSGAMLPTYDALRVGDILRATSTSRVRKDPTTNSQALGSIDAGGCVRITAAPTRKLPNLTSASSGGWLEVQAVECAAPAQTPTQGESR